MECEQIWEDLPAFDNQAFSVEVTEHIEQCDDCREMLEQYRELSLELAALEAIDVSPPAWLEAAIIESTMERLRRTAALRAASRQLGEHRGVAAGGAILLAGLAGAILVGRSRKRPALTPPAAA